MKTKEFNFNKELEKWFKKWNRKVVTGRCLIELKQRDKEFIRRYNEILDKIYLGQFKDQFELLAYVTKEFNKLAGDKLR